MYKLLKNMMISTEGKSLESKKELPLGLKLEWQAYFSL